MPPSTLIARPSISISTSLPPPPPAAAAPAKPGIIIRELNVWFGDNHALKNVSLEIPDKNVTAIIGPSGCGKSTLIRALNRMHETTPGARVEGRVTVHGEDILGSGSRSRAGPPQNRHGVPKSQSLPHHEHL